MTRIDIAEEYVTRVQELEGIAEELRRLDRDLMDLIAQWEKHFPLDPVAELKAVLARES